MCNWSCRRCVRILNEGTVIRSVDIISRLNNKKRSVPLLPRNIIDGNAAYTAPCLGKVIHIVVSCLDQSAGITTVEQKGSRTSVTADSGRQ